MSDIKAKTSGITFIKLYKLPWSVSVVFPEKWYNYDNCFSKKKKKLGMIYVILEKLF